MTNTLNSQTDTVYIVRIDGTRLGPFQTQFDPIKVLIHEVTLNAGGGDTLELQLPGQAPQQFLITTTHFQPQMSGVQAHYTIRLRRES